jgi:hypothetical protein
MLQLKAVAAGTMNLPLPRQGGDASASGAGSPFNPYNGDLWDPSDFSLRPGCSPGSPGWDGFW